MNYRHDIQGLRALAILAVVAFHLNPAWLPGGFTGVDVFFVISGYLITGLLLKSGEARPRVGRFYLHRLLRLFPAYLVMLCGCALAVYLFVFPKQTMDFGQSLISAVAMVSNVYFAAHINYLSVDVHLLPLLHTWSLSAEAQCYLVYPLILLFMTRFKVLSPVWALSGLFAAMFVLNLALTAYNADVAFFSPTVRFYQFLGGAVIYLLPDTVKLSRSLIMQATLIMGLMMILASFFVIDPFTVYPGIYSLLPTVGTMLVIVSGIRYQLTSAGLLTNKPMVFIGGISYSLYLWHWPVIVFYKIRISPVLTIADCGVILLISLILATLSRILLEKKFRAWLSQTPRPKVVGGTVLAGLVLVLAGTLYVSTNGLRQRFDPQQLFFAETDFSQKFIPAKATDSCMVYKNWIESFTEQQCIHIDAGKTNLLLLGDSHAEHLRRALEDHSDALSVSVVTVSACRPTLPGTGRPACVDMMNRVYHELIQRYRFDMALVSARWSLQTVEQMHAAIQALKQQIERVVVVGPIVTYAQSLPLLLARYGPDLNQSAMLEKIRFYQQAAEVDQRFRQIAGENGAEYVSLVELLCPGGECRIITQSGVPVQWDYGHLTHQGAGELIAKMKLF